MNKIAVVCLSEKFENVGFFNSVYARTTEQGTVSITTCSMEKRIIFYTNYVVMDEWKRQSNTVTAQRVHKIMECGKSLALWQKAMTIKRTMISLRLLWASYNFQGDS